MSLGTISLKIYNKMTNSNICFEKSFASHEKAKCWHSTKNDKEARDVLLNSVKKCWFTCADCKHDFSIGLNSVNRGTWCPYCSNKKLCDNECNVCFKKSFASHKQAKCWHPTKNDIKARDVLLNSKKRFFFTCDDCNHDFFARVPDRNNRHRCPYCSNNKLCENECNVCFKKSFASHEKAKYWHPTRNDKEPRDVFLNSNKRFFFTCDDPNCNHDFSVRLHSVNIGNGCPYCWDPTKNDKEPRDVSLNSNNFLFYIYNYITIRKT
jgi:DNA-directed RNA polymerase subunit RPC12/RpoP